MSAKKSHFLPNVILRTLSWWFFEEHEGYFGSDWDGVMWSSESRNVLWGVLEYFFSFPPIYRLNDVRLYSLLKLLIWWSELSKHFKQCIPFLFLAPLFRFGDETLPRIGIRAFHANVRHVCGSGSEKDLRASRVRYVVIVCKNRCFPLLRWQP